MTATIIKNTPKIWQWYDLSKAGLFIAPEKVCGQSCLILLDTNGFFKEHNRADLIENGFMPFFIEDDPNISSHLYVSFIDNFNIELFYSKLNVPIGTIKSVQLTLSEIQNELYQRALRITNYRVDLLLKTTSILGRNNKEEVVYISHFGRFIIDSSADVQTYLLENIFDERFLHATNPTALIACVEGFVKYALKHKINLGIKDVAKFASIVFQKKNEKIDLKKVRPSDIYTLLEVFDFVYTKNIPYLCPDISTNFSDKDFFDQVCELYECQPHKPSVPTEYQMNSQSTPTPISFIAQKLLVEGDKFEDKVVLNPMFGYGSLTNFLATHAIHISGLEENPIKTDLIECTNIPHTMVKLACAVSENLIDYNSMSLYDYVIANPAFEKIDDHYRFEDGLLNPLVTQRKDHILFVKSLLCREDKGRSVFILHLNDQSNQLELDNDLNALLQFISARYKIEGLTRISGELYSKIDPNFDVALIVVGEKFEKLSYSQHINFVSYLQSSVIADYQSLWVWCESICYLRSKEFIKNNEVLDKLAEVEYENFINKVNDELTLIEDLNPSYYSAIPKVEAHEDPSNFEQGLQTTEDFENFLIDGNPLPSHEEGDWNYANNFDKNDSLFGFASEVDQESKAQSEQEHSNTDQTDEVETSPVMESASNGVDENSVVAESTTEPPSTENRIQGAVSINLGGLSLDDDDVADESENHPVDHTATDINLTESNESSVTAQSTDPASETQNDTETKVESEVNTGSQADTEPKTDSEGTDSEGTDSEKLKVESSTEQEDSSTAVSLSKKSEGSLSEDEEFISEKVAEKKANLFDAKAISTVIRSHSATTLTETTSNVRVRHFSSHLKAKAKLQTQVLNAFNFLNPDYHKDKKMVDSWNERATKLNSYLTAFKCNPSIESFVSCYLKTGRIENLGGYFLAEHIDAIATAILRSQLDESLFLIDSPGLMPEIVIAATIRYAMLQNQLIVYVARNLDSFNRLYDVWVEMQERFPADISTEFKVVSFIVSTDQMIEDLSTNQVLVLTQDDACLEAVEKSKSKLSDSFKDIKKLCIFDVYDENAKLPTVIKKVLDESPTIFLSNQFIRPESDFKLYKSLFTNDMYQRYFASPISDLDEVACDLLKSSLIEDGLVIERFEDLSNLDVESIENDVAKKAIYERISEIISIILNKIIDLAALTRKHLVNSQNTTHQYIDIDFKAMALDILKYANFSLKAETLTQAIVNAIKTHTKPVIVVPNSLESMLYKLLQFEIQIDDQTNLSSLNELIAYKAKEVEKQNLIAEITGDDRGYAKLSAEINTLVQRRSNAVSKYLLLTISGTEKKIQPQLSDLIELFFIQATLVEEVSDDLFRKNYKSIVPNEVRDLYNQIKDLILKLPSIPLMMLDNIKYDLGKFNINVGELSSRTIALKKTDSIDVLSTTPIWGLDPKQPYQEKLIKLDEEINLVHSFNSGYIDVLFVEANEINSQNLASINYAQYGVPSDHYRQRVLMFTYFDLQIEDILRLINTVNKRDQWIQPSIRFVIGESIGERISYNLITQQLDLYSVRNDYPESEFKELSFYLTNVGQNTLIKYLTLNPEITKLMPSKNVKTWTIFDLIHICSLSSQKDQFALYDEMIHFYESYLHYLKNINAHPFELYYVKPKARMRSVINVDSPLRLNQSIRSDRKFAHQIQGVTLEYLKDKSRSIKQEDLISLQEFSIGEMKEDLKNAIPAELYKGEVIQDLNTYIANYEHLVLTVYGKRIKQIILDENDSWKFKGLNIDHTKAAKMYFGLSKSKKQKVSYLERIDKIIQNLATLYVAIEIVGDVNIKRSYDEACQILTFLKCYTLSIIEMSELTTLSPVILNVPSPYREYKVKQDEGLMLGMKLPKLGVSALSACSFKAVFAYPRKSKPKDINLAYILDHRSVLMDQNVIAGIPKGLQDFICKPLLNDLDKEQVKFKLSKFNNDALKRFALVSDYGESVVAPIIRAFNEKIQPIVSRKLDIFYGNPFEIYYTLKNSIPITAAGFIDPTGVNQIGFIIPPEIEINSAILCLEESASLVSIRKIVDRIVQKEAWYNFPIIQFVNRMTSITVSPMDEHYFAVSLKGQEHELQNILLEPRIFGENRKDSLGLVIDTEHTSYSGNKSILSTQIEMSKISEFIKILIDQNYYQLSIVRSCNPEIKHRYFNTKSANKIK